MASTIATSSSRRKVEKKKSAAMGEPIGPHHPLRRGDFAAVVFCGATKALGELPGEPTAHALFKFALPDPRLSRAEDFAHSAGAALPIWPADRIAPIDGVCFAFADSENPHAKAMVAAGAKLDRHLLILDRCAPADESAALAARIAGFASNIPLERSMVVLGYGHQGRRLARTLTEECGVDRARVLIHESSIDSRHAAAHDGFTMIDSGPWPEEVGGVVYSPLMRHENLYVAFERAMRSGLVTFDNSQKSSGLRQFVRRGRVSLDAVSDGALVVESDSVIAKPHGLPLTLHIVRHGLQRINGVEFPTLQAAGSHRLRDGADAIDIAGLESECGLATCTRGGSRRLNYSISLRNRPDHGYFAAREFCAALWPGATRDVFPSEHVVDLGATSFERLLQGHIVGREIASTMQTPAQRATIGIAARHYAVRSAMIEIGSAFGGSALLMAAATDQHRPPLFSIDPETSTRDIMRFAFQREGHVDRLTQLIQTSDQAICELVELRGKAGLVFIDGLHTEQGVRADFINYAPLVAPGGALLFHDVCPQIHSVMRVVFDEVLADPRFEIKCMVDGLAVFERRGG